MAWGYQLNTEIDFKSPFFWPEFAFQWGAVGLLGGGATTTKSATPSSVSTTSKADRGFRLPSWISSLQDSALKTDFTSFHSAGSITEAEMAKALGDLAAELNAAEHDALGEPGRRSQIHRRQYRPRWALRRILQFITNAFVNGNPANASWTGGAAKSVALGNLGAGYSVTQLNELTGKWFLGTDLPSNTVSMSGASTFTVTYSAVNSPLFGAIGPSMSDINQGELGDCYLLCALAEVANQDPSAITSMITNNGNGTYGVRFYVDGVARYVTVDNQLANGGSAFNSASTSGRALSKRPTRKSRRKASSPATASTTAIRSRPSAMAAVPNYTFEEITGATAITDFDASGSTLERPTSSIKRST